MNGGLYLVEFFKVEQTLFISLFFPSLAMGILQVLKSSLSISLRPWALESVHLKQMQTLPLISSVFIFKMKMSYSGVWL